MFLACSQGVLGWPIRQGDADFEPAKHLMSCDNDPRVEEWLLKTHHPKVYVKDIAECSDSIIYDKQSKQLQPVPSSTAAFCSWVCHDAYHDSSTYN